MLILHGEEDALIPVGQVRALAKARDGVVLETYPRWGHDLVIHEAAQDRIARFLEGN